jgi:hypothetical protein
MEAAATSEYTTSEAENKELKRLCTVFGVSQSNRLYRLLNTNDKTEVTAQLIREEHVKSDPSRGGDSCEVGQIWDAVRGTCV